MADADATWAAEDAAATAAADVDADVDDDVGPAAAALALCSAGDEVSAFRDGRFAGGRRADGTFPRLCMPCLRGAAFLVVDGSMDSPCRWDGWDGNWIRTMLKRPTQIPNQ